MARRTKEEAQQTRCHIMSTALDLFCSQGLAKTSLTDIARAADLTRGAIYWHFKNKDELFISLWKELCSPLAHQLDACLNTDEPDPLGQLRIFFEGVLHSFIHNPAQRQMFTLLFNLESLEGEAISLREHIRSESAHFFRIWRRPWPTRYAGASCQLTLTCSAPPPCSTAPWMATSSTGCTFRGGSTCRVNQPS